ncbi:MAG: hypothetical protein ABFR33_03380 [Verrucomicrobiota bacterium]
MKKWVVFALALVAGSASAAFELTDSHWTNFWLGGATGSTTTNSVVDTATDPGYEWGITIDPTEDWGAGPNTAGFQEIAVSMPSNTVSDLWRVTVQNTHATSTVKVQLMGWLSTTPGGGDWGYTQSGVWSAELAPGAVETLVWDVAVSAPYIDALALMVVGTVAGGTDVSVEVVPNPPIILQDADWANLWLGGSNGSTTTNSVVDIVGDPGYEFNVAIDPTEDWGLGSLVGFQEIVVSMSGAEAATWEVVVKNTHATSTVRAQLVGWVTTNGVAGGGQWIYQQSAVWSAELAPGESQALSWDLASHTVGGNAVTAIDALGLMVAGTAAGGTDVSLSVVPGLSLPMLPVLYDADWATAWEGGGNDAGSTVTLPGTDIVGNPGYQFDVTVNPTEDWGWGSLLGFKEIAVSMPSNTASGVWRATVKNTHATSTVRAQLFGWLSTTPGGGDWTYTQSGIWTAELAPGTSQALEWDVAASAPYIDALALMVAGTAAGGADVSLSVVPDPDALTELVLYDAQWATFAAGGGEAGAVDDVVDIANDPGSELQMTVDGDGVLIGYVGMGATTEYAGLPWRVEVLNTNAFAVNVKQVIWTDGWANFIPDEAGALSLDPGQSAAFSMDITTDPLDGVGFVFAGPVGAVNMQIIGPQPGALTSAELYALWTEDYPTLTDTDLMVDFEPDGMVNLLEYALGGDPTVDDAATVEPVSTFPDANTWVYVYKRRNGSVDHGLTYDLQYKTDLVLDPTWISGGGAGETVDSSDPVFDVVTNTIPTYFEIGEGGTNVVWDETLFLKLEITGSGF